MRRLIQRHASTILVAFVTAVVTAGGPAIAASIADYARNAGKVDGKSAVGAGASARNRAGKLVATDRRGRLPNNIIAKARDAEAVDGVSAEGLQRRVSGECPAGSAMSAISASGHALCTTVAGGQTTGNQPFYAHIELLSAGVTYGVSPDWCAAGWVPVVRCTDTEEARTLSSTTLNRDAIPATASLTVQYLTQIPPTGEACMRLRSLTTGEVVGGSEACIDTQTAPGGAWRDIERSIVLPPGRAKYVIEALAKPISGGETSVNFQGARLIVEDVPQP